MYSSCIVTVLLVYYNAMKHTHTYLHTRTHIHVHTHIQTHQLMLMVLVRRWRESKWCHFSTTLLQFLVLFETERSLVVLGRCSFGSLNGAEPNERTGGGKHQPREETGVFTWGGRKTKADKLIMTSFSNVTTIKSDCKFVLLFAVNSAQEVNISRYELNLKGRSQITPNYYFTFTPVSHSCDASQRAKWKQSNIMKTKNRIKFPKMFFPLSFK